VLLRFEGLKDGIVLQGESSNDVSRLCAIVSLEKNIEKLALREHLRKHLDSAFVPRPIYVVDALPRESNGKLLKAKLSALLAELKAN
jgi:acyl-coenzyme A synthetase/AMP-(fatty) acid ligase